LVLAFRGKPPTVKISQPDTKIYSRRNACISLRHQSDQQSLMGEIRFREQLTYVLVPTAASLCPDLKKRKTVITMAILDRMIDPEGSSLAFRPSLASWIKTSHLNFSISAHAPDGSPSTGSLCSQCHHVTG
jgi:hypothetical protein